MGAALRARRSRPPEPARRRRASPPDGRTRRRRTPARPRAPDRRRGSVWHASPRGLGTGQLSRREIASGLPWRRSSERRSESPGDGACGSDPRSRPVVMVDQLHFTPNEDANRLLAAEPFAADGRDAARPAGADGVGVPGARAPEGALGRHPRRGCDRGDAGRGGRGDLPGEAGAAPLPGIDGEAHPRPVPSSWSSTTTAGPRTCGPTRRPATSCWPGSRRCPGFGNDKARIFVGLLGKRLGVQPPGWEQAAADWASIADVDSYDRVMEIREQKRAAKAEKRGSSSRRRRPQVPRCVRSAALG